MIIAPETYRRVYFLYTPQVVFGSYFDQIHSDPHFHWGVLMEGQQLTTAKTQVQIFDNMADWLVWAGYCSMHPDEVDRITDEFNL
jgi:hypothetical protein